jgi:hypothetical protein
VSIPPSARQRVVGEQLRLLMKSPLPIHTGTASVLLVAFVLRNNLAAAELCGWSALALVVQALRYWLRWRIRSVDADALTARRWGVPIAILMTASGLLWGLFSLSIDRVDDADMRSFIILIVTSLMTGGAVSFTAYLPACYGYLLAAALPITAALALRGTSAYLLMSCVGAGEPY